MITDEIAFWRSDYSANYDHEIINALYPNITTPGGNFLTPSLHYAHRDALWDTLPSPIRQAPSLPNRVVDEAMERDPEAARAEYMAEFRSDLEQFIQREVVDAAVRTSPLELPFDKANRYHAFTDPAGGGADEFTLAIGHLEDKRFVVDLLRARRGTPAAIVAEYAATLKSYELKAVTGDRYAGSWPADEFQRCGITYQQAEKPKSDLYVNLLPALNSGRVELPPDDRLVNQLVALERRTSRSGRDSIDHPAGGHDDRANVIAGLMVVRERRPVYAVFGTYGNHVEPSYGGAYFKSEH